MDLEVRHLRLVGAIAEEGTLTRASERLHLTQSALSHQLFQIEERLGTELFLRTGKRMVLTGAGERVLHAARTILDELERTETDVQQIAGSLSGTLRVTTECYTCYHWVSPLLEEFYQTHPGIMVVIDPESTFDPEAALLDGRIDLGIVSNRKSDKRLVYEPAFSDELFLMVRPVDLLASKRFVTPKDFVNRELLLYATLEESKIFKEVLEPAGLVPRKHRTVRLTEAMVEMIRAGFGVAVMAAWAVSPELEAGKLVAVRINPQGLRREWRTAVCRERAEVPYIRDFARLVQKKPPTLWARETPLRTLRRG